MQQIHGKLLEWQNSPTVADELLPRTGVEKNYYQGHKGDFWGNGNVLKILVAV